MAKARPKKRLGKARQSAANTSGATTGYEAEMWAMADALRGSMDAAEYKHVVLGLIFLKYISDAFEETHAQLKAEVGEGADPEDPDEYRAQNIFWVPTEARWAHLKAQARQPTIGQKVDEAMTCIERDNPVLKDVLPKDYARPSLDKVRLGQLIDMISNIQVGDEDARSKDVLGRVYEYFLSQFASAEGKKGGEFYTPRCVVKLLVEMLEPYQGRVYDPCCGSSGMFVQSVKFIREHATGNGNGGKVPKGPRPDISIYGQESNYTTWRLAKMNLAIRGIEGQIAHGDTFHNDQHPDLKADFILANPPFNVSDWGGQRLTDDKRWQYGNPPPRNANFAWVQHIVHHLAPRGTAGFVVALPGQLFYSTQIPACLWFIARDRHGQPSPGVSRHPLPEVEGESLPRDPHSNPFPEGEGHYRGGFDFSGLLEKAREMRKRATPSEALVWELFRDRRFLGLKFRRQHQIGAYVADYYCHEKLLVVELDGPVHQEGKRRSLDAKRDAYLKSLGITVLRIRNERLLHETDAVLNEIANAVQPSPSEKEMDPNEKAKSEILPSPSGRGAGVRVNRFRDRRHEILFIDARKLGFMVDRTHRDFKPKDIARISGTYHAWRSNSPHPVHEDHEQDNNSPLPLGEGQGEGVAVYRDIPGFCKSASLEEVRKHGYVLTPGRYVGVEPQEEDLEPFEEKMKRLTAQWREQQTEARKLDAAIEANLETLGFGDNR